MGNEVSEKWQSWLRHFKLMLAIKQIEDIGMKKTMLLYTAGTQVQDVYEALPNEVPSDNENEFDVIVRVLTNHFVKKRNVTFERHVFRGLQQGPTEKIEQFVLRLRQQALKCNFANQLEDNIKDQLIEKCLSTELKTKILDRSDDLSLADAIRLATNHETIQEQLSAMKLRGNSLNSGDGNGTAVNKVTSNRFGRSKPRAGSTTERSQIECRSCGKRGHIANDPSCPARGKKCYGCGKLGHFGSKCFQRKRNADSESVKSEPSEKRGRNIQNVTTSEEQANYIFRLEDECNENEVVVVLGGVKTKVVIDSGSKFNLIDIDSWQRLKAQNVAVRNMKLGSDRILKSYGGHKLEIIGMLEAIVCVGDTTTECSFYVMKEKGNILIGSDTAKSMGLLVVGVPVNQIQTTESVKMEPLGKIRNVMIKLPIDESVRPVQQPYRRVPVPLESAVEHHIQEMLEQDIIEKVDGTSDWVSPMVVVPRSNGSVRICIDMRQANHAIKRTPYGMPTFEELMPHVGKGKFFSRLDLKQAFHQCELHPNSRHITTFIAKSGLYRYKRLMFGVVCAPEEFQKHMEIILLKCEGAYNFADDVIVNGRNKTEHDERLKCVLNTFKTWNVTLNWDKCTFCVTKMDFLGHHLTSNGISPSKAKLETIKKMRAPKTTEEVRSFLGVITYLSCYIPDMATKTDPLRQLLKKDTKFAWQNIHQNAFEQLKLALMDERILGYFDVTDRTQVFADASPVGLGSILVQISPDGRPRVITCASKSLTATEKRYCQTEKEALALVWAVEKFYMYLYGIEFDLITDHQAHLVIFGPRSKTCARIERWVLRLQSFRYKMVFKPGKYNIADVFSRLCQENEHPIAYDEDAENYVSTIVEAHRPIAIKLYDIEEESRSDIDITSVGKALCTGRWPNELHLYKSVSDELCFSGDILLRGMRIVMPNKLRIRTIELAHEGHPGMSAMKQRLRSKVWWPKMDSMADEFVRKCRMCLEVSAPPKPEPLRVTEMPTAPWQHIAIDFLGPIPSGEYLLVTVDYFSRYYEVDIMKSIESNEVIKRLRVIFARWGVPISMKMDNGRQLISEEFKTFCDEYNINKVHTIPYWPQMNGEVERQNRSILKILKISHAAKSNWKQDLVDFLFMYRTTPHTVTGKKPLELMLGRQIKDKLPQIDAPLEEKVEHAEARERDAIYKEKNRQYADNRRQARSSNIRVGDKVIAKNMIKANKLTPTFGSTKYEVVNRSGSEITIRDDNGREYRRNVAHAKAIPNEIAEGKGENDGDIEMGSASEAAPNQHDDTEMASKPKKQKAVMERRELPKRNVGRPERYQ